MKGQGAIRAAGLLALGMMVGFTLAWAGGSFDRDTQLLPVLRQQPELAKFLTDSLEIDDGGSALRIGPHIPALTGKRIAPYLIEAKPKGQKGPYTFWMEVEADVTFFDAVGRKLDRDKDVDYEKAVRVEERLKAVKLWTIPAEQRDRYPRGEGK